MTDQQDTSPRRILLVEDEGMVAVHLQRLLMHFGYAVPAVVDRGETAIARALELRPDLILMDIQLAGAMDGIETAHRIQAHFAVPVVYLAASVDDERLRQVAATCPYGYLLKPVHERELRVTLDMALYKHRLDQRLQAGEAYLRATFEQAAVGICNTTPDGRFLRVNRKMCAILGYTEAELQALTFRDVTHPDDLAANLADFQRALTGEIDTYTVEKRYIRKDGALVWVNLTSSLVRGSGGEPQYFIAVIEDITARKHAEEQLRQAEVAAKKANAFREAMLETAAEGICICHPIDTPPYIAFTLWNQRMTEITGYTQEEINRHGWCQTLYPDPEDQQRATGRMQQMQQGDQLHGEEWIITRKDNALSAVEISTSMMENDNGIPAVAAFVHDVTERKLAEDELRNSLSLLQATLESTADGILVVDRQGRITKFNRRFVELWRAPAAIMETGDDKQLQDYMWVQLKDPQLFNAKVQELYAHPEQESVDLLEFKDGRVFERYSIPQRLDGDISGRVWSFSDMTARTRAELKIRNLNETLEQRVLQRTAELSRANADLAKAGRAKDEFLATMSHELRTPLNGIIGMAEILQLQSYGPLTEKQIGGLRTIQECGQHLLSLINDVLDVAKIEAGKLEIEIGPVAVDEICRASLRLVEQGAHIKRQQVQYDLKPAELTVQADSRRFKQMLVNLLSNAVKFTPEGGELGLDVVGDAEAQVVRFTVWDHGIGIREEDLPRLFKPFEQLDSRLSRQYAGTGLGLSLVQQMARLHGGEVSVKSTPGRGSRFTLVLP